MTVILTVIVLSLIGSFFCSLCEAVLYAVTPMRVEVMRLAGVAGCANLHGQQFSDDQCLRLSLFPAASLPALNEVFTHCLD
jgi:hypothetical protein